MAAEYDEQLRAKGFFCYERCKCSGVYIEKYKPINPDISIDVKIFPVNRTFLIYKNFYQEAKGALTIFNTTLNKVCSN